MKSKEVEMRISDLLAMLLKAFKPILCIAILVGLIGGVLGAYSVAKAKPRVTQEDVEAAEKDVAKAENDLALAQNTLIFRNEVKLPGARDKIERDERMILQLQDYMKSSMYYGMNPFHRGAARIRFAVEAADAVPDDTVNPSDNLLSGIVIAYTQMCPFSTEVIEQVGRIIKAETQTQYIEELITVSCDDDLHVVEICVFNDDLQVGKKAADYLFQTLRESAEKTLPKHQVTVLSTYAGYEVDWDLSEKQIKVEKDLADAEKALLDANNSLQTIRNNTSEEQAVANASAALSAAKRNLQNAKYSYSKNRPSFRSMAKKAIKFGLLGGVIGLIVSSGLILIKGLLGGIIQNQNEVASRYSFPLIGVLPRTKKWVLFDKTIRKLEGEPVGDYQAITQATIQSLLSRTGERSVCLISTGSGAVAKKLASSIGERVTVLDSITNNAEAVKELANYDGIILVEERGKSRLDAVDAEVLRAKTLGKDIIGIVLA